MRSAFRRPDLAPRALSLRTRLVVLLVALAVVGLAVADFVSYRALHSYLYDRVDQQLESAFGPVTVRLLREAGEEGPTIRAFGPAPGVEGAVEPEGAAVEGGVAGQAQPDGGPTEGHLPATAYGELRDSEGGVVAETGGKFFGREVATPQLPKDLTATRYPMISPVTVGEAGGGSEQFRAAAVKLGAGEAVVAVPLGETIATLNHLVVIELVVSGAILVALGLAAWWLVGVGLRPLRRMGEVAGQIAAGDLSRRVEPDNDRTEVGRLGRSLNAMLAQIEAAFAERAAGERRLRRFLADASHELRTPLASIRGYSELYRMGAAREPAEVDRAMGRIESESARMGGLVDDLLTLARIDEVREPAREPLDLRELLEDARDDARAAAPERQVTLTPSGPVAIQADGDALRRVFANLLRNAVVHTPEGTSIELGLRTTEGQAIVTVRDHGPGLPPEDPNAVFERFWRDSDSRGRDDGGAGLGLAIVAGLVASHGGRVEASNPGDGGALFTVELPLR